LPLQGWGDLPPLLCLVSSTAVATRVLEEADRQTSCPKVPVPMSDGPFITYFLVHVLDTFPAKRFPLNQLSSLP
jgi:hypothetical protein